MESDRHSWHHLRALISVCLRESVRTHERLLETCVDDLARAAWLIRTTVARGGKVLLCGNGGSAGDAQHIAAELVGRFVRERAPLPAIALTVDTSILTAVGNDYGFEQVFARQVLALGGAGDVLVAISTSGRSPNVIAACLAARSRGMQIVGLTGQGGDRLAELSDAAVRVPSRETARIQECHIAVGHLICEAVDALDLPDPVEVSSDSARRHRKELGLDEAVRLRAIWRERGLTVAWTNGCFDVLHAGHVRSLAAARAQGDLLVVGVNTDAAVRALKGDDRPIFPVAERLAVLGALEMVDHVVVFDELTPERVLGQLRPDVHCKGADYAPPNGAPLPEAKVVEAYGGRIAFLPLVSGLSTTATVERMGLPSSAVVRPVVAGPARAIFCDRDGTLIPDAEYPRSPDQIQLLPGVAAALSALQQRGFLLVIISNQSGVGRGLISREQFEAVHRRFAELFLESGVALDGAYYCLHAPAEACSCRKPKPGLLEQATRELGIDSGRSYFVGDKLSDLEAGRSAGCRTVYFGTGGAGATADASISSWDQAARVFI